MYAINSITDAVVAGTVDSARIVTSAQERAQFFQGMGVLFTTNPVTTASAAWNHWEQLPTEDRLISGAAALVSLPKGATSASVLADIMPVGSAAGHAAPKTMIGAVGDLGKVPNLAAAREVGSVSDFPTGSFSISDWSGYPAGVPRPQGPFRMVEGAEYDAARKAANKANASIRREQGLVGQPVDVHEVQPVKFGGSPTDPANKVVLPRDTHRQQVTPWWNQLQKDLDY